MNYGKKLTTLALIIACGIVIECDYEKKRQGLVLIPSLLGGNASPVADAGADQRVSILKGSVDLDGSESYDPEGKDLAFSWTVRYQPTGSNFSFSQPAGAATSFIFDTAGTYEIMLTVNDGSVSNSDMVTVDVAVNNGPTANAGSDREVTVGDTVSLDGSGSTDPEEDVLTYTWTQISGPAIGTGTLTGLYPSFTAPSEVCTIAYDLRVDDGSGDSFADRVYIFVMKKGGAGIYVATTGDDAYEGTRARPLKTITAAVSAALSAGSDVYVSAGIYDESVTLANGVSLFGGFDPSSWVRGTFKSSETPAYITTIQGGTIAVDGNGVKNAIIDGFTVLSANATTAGQGSYAVRLINSTIELKNSIITSGNGYTGQNGSNGSEGSPGNNGSTGEDGIADIGSLWDVPTVNGGAGGTSPGGRSGGNGGYGGWCFTVCILYICETDAGDGGTGSQGINGTLGGAGGATVNPGHNGSGGCNGTAGSPGINGSGGSSGSVTGYHWISSPGNDGGVGDPGNGGGGGGGGGGQYMIVPLLTGCGNGGGGGGGGGTGGSGGTGGYGGGASFGVFLIESIITVNNCIITSGNGGSGGAGGNGGTGGAGGPGGSGGTKDTDEVGRGGNGGSGGNGGKGGAGGGGAGGPSFVIYKNGWFSGVIISGTTLTPGTGGAGGISSGNTGTAGECGYIGGE